MISLDIKPPSLVEIARWRTGIQRLIPEIFEFGLRAAAPVLVEAVKRSASGENLNLRSGNLAEAVRVVYLRDLAGRSTRCQIYVDSDVAPYASKLERGEEIWARGDYLRVPLSTNPLYSLSGPLQRSGADLSSFGEYLADTFRYLSAAGDYITARREPGGGITNLFIWKERVKMPHTRWFSKAINEAFPDFLDKFIDALRERAPVKVGR